MPVRALREQIPYSPMDRPIDAPLLTRARVLGGLLLFLVALAAIAGFVRYGTGRTLVEKRGELVISTVHNGAFSDYIPLTGTIQPFEVVYLDAVDGGQVAAVLVEEGALVSAGQPLVRLNNANLHLQVINSEAQLSEQLNRLASTRLQFEQSRLMHDRDDIDFTFQVDTASKRLARFQAAGVSGAIKRADIEDAALDLERLQRLQAAQRRARAADDRLQQQEMEQVDRTMKGLSDNLEVARRNLDNLTIKAPINGRLTSLDAYVGESKATGQRIGQIDQVDRYKVEALVDEHYLPRLAVGQKATGFLGEKSVMLRVRKIYPEVSDRSFKVDLEFVAAPSADIRRGMSVQMRLEEGAQRRGLLLDNGPFYEDTSGTWVFVLNESRTEARRRAVQLGRRNPEVIEVLGGLRAGDAVITSDYGALREFSKIELR